MERVARLIGKIARAERPRFRYTPGPFVERISPTVRRLIPDRLYLRIIAGFYGLKISRPARKKEDSRWLNKK